MQYVQPDKKSINQGNDASYEIKIQINKHKTINENSTKYSILQNCLQTGRFKLNISD